MNIQTKLRPSPGMSEKPLTVSVKRFGTILDIGNTKSWELIGTGQVQTIRVGRKCLVLYRSVEDLVEKLAKEAAAAGAKTKNSISDADPKPTSLRK